MIPAASVTTAAATKIIMDNKNAMPECKISCVFAGLEKTDT
jgi:hypothetical protein